MLYGFTCAIDRLELLMTEVYPRLEASGWAHPAEFVEDMTVAIPGQPGATVTVGERNLPSNDVAHSIAGAMNARFRVQEDLVGCSQLDLSQAELLIRWNGGHQLRLRVGEEFKPRRRFTSSERELVMRFESLGSNCEFGMLQRMAGFERLSLFRYAGTQSVDSLIAAVTCDFAGFATPDDLDMQPFHGTWDALSKLYDFTVHTYIDMNKLDEDAARTAESTKLQFLASKLLEDIEVASKVFVRRENDGNVEYGMWDLYRALRQKGPANLLWVTECGKNRSSGHVEQLSDGLFRGYVNRLTPFLDAPAVNPDTWISLLEKFETEFLRLHPP